MADPDFGGAALNCGVRYGIRFRKAMTTSPTIAKAVAAIMTFSFHMIAFATLGPVPAQPAAAEIPEALRQAGKPPASGLSTC
jgi:hypothetical protein